MLSNRQLFFNHVAQTSLFPLALEIARAKGSFMYDAHNKSYLDLISGIGVSNVGHCHPKIIEAIKEQSEKYLHLMVYGEFVQHPQVQLATAISKYLPFSDQSSIYFVNSGSEAVEGAIKLAKRYTGKPEIVSCLNAYHGSSHGALSVMGNETFKQAFRPLLPGITHIHHNKIEDLEKITTNVAAVIIEVIQGEAGIRIASLAYLEALRSRCNETGTLLIYDEIQTGFGRTGKMFAFDHFKVYPDIVLMAKGMGGGMPIGAFAATKEIMNCLTSDPILGHITTFGGHPVSCASSLACLNVIVEESLVEHAKSLESILKEQLVHPAIKEIRGLGLIHAIQLDNFENNYKLIEFCLENGVFTDWFLFCDDALRIAPPLNISKDELTFGCSIINDGLTKIYGQLNA